MANCNMPTTSGTQPCSMAGNSERISIGLKPLMRPRCCKVVTAKVCQGLGKLASEEAPWEILIITDACSCHLLPYRILSVDAEQLLKE